MGRLFIISIVIFSLFVGGLASADKAILEHNGQSGIWFDEGTSSLMLQDLTEFKLIKTEQLPELNTKIKLQKLNIENLKLELAVTEEISKKWQGALKVSEDLRNEEAQAFQKELERKDTWYKSPVFLLISGVILGGALAVGLSFGLNGSNNI